MGALCSALPPRIRLLGKSVFYFGLIFFALDLISAQLKPLQQEPLFIEWLALAQAPWLGLVTGLVFTALVQSSSVTSGVAILLAQQGALPVEAAIPIVVGANVGSTSTALLASLGMGAVARATAFANALFNGIGAVLYFPFLAAFSHAMVSIASDPGLAVASAHLVFNLSISLAFLVAMPWFEPWLRRRLLSV